ncbi:MAG: MerR family transcriptional regulator [Lachnospiraceae bacterium]|nr:MerR family transcriptional regulator [Lachnospiraceae bacterium]
MMTVNEVSRLTGVSIRTLHYYDKIGLLHPAGTTESGYRLYDDTALERLQHILLFRELQFPLKEIRQILDSPVFDRNRALEQQITLLELQKEHLENLIDLARGIKMIGVKRLDFSAFDTRKIDEYAKQAKASWGKSFAWKEFEEKNKNRAPEDMQKINIAFMSIFAEFGKLLNLPPEDEAVQKLVKKLQEFITEHFYTCTPDILRSLGRMYAGGGEMTENIDKVSGKGTADFAAAAIEVYCG